ncbi:hypothetical protein JNUCC32_30100 [Paenibacillus sp. JNUCC32]|uniref:hypothetical protein n=1 Tax=Paenibacillus sp. JNUCC32 TaxID=2777984 RepID=UPI001787C0B1|nr:hypothetical protein [Paenibacillus sp. JNUCC-32]QOT10286.1 hypothetical protein JNUCC32_30100 [Paenibacillus sp. JNUCC-32]
MASVKDALSYFNNMANDVLVGQWLQFEKGYEQVVKQITKAKEEQEKLTRTTAKSVSYKEKMLQMTEKVVDGIEQMNQKMGEGEKKASALSKAFKFAKSAYKAGEIVVKTTIAPAAQEQKLEDLFKVKAGNAEVGTAMFQTFKNNALKTGTDVNQSLENALSFMSITKNSDQLTQLTGFADRMSMMSSGNKSSKDATEAIMSAMRGDTSSLAKNFNIPDAQIKSFNAEIISSKGNFTAFLSSMDKLLQKSGMTQESLASMMDSPVNKWQKLLGLVDNSFVQIGTGALAAIIPLMEMISVALESGAFQPFIDALTIGLSVLVQVFMWIAELVPPAWEFIKGAISGVGVAIWNVISIFMGLLPIITFAAVLLGILNIGLITSRIVALGYGAAQLVAAMKTNLLTAATSIQAGAMRILNMIINANPLMFLIALIIAVISAFGVWSVVTQGLKKVFSNVFGFIVDLAQNTVNTVISVINGIIKGVNAVAGFFGKVLGVDTKQIAEIEYKADFTNFKDTGQKAIEDFSMDTFKDKFMPDKSLGKNNEDLLKQYNTGKTGYDVTVPKTTPTPSMPAMPTAPIPVAPAGGSIDSIGKVDNSVDVASEDLKVMRDLAEVNAISNMITLTPTVQMTTGDINSGADLDTIMSRINRTLEEQFVSSAEGVYL